MTPQLRDDVQTLTTFAQNFGYACLSYDDFFFNRPLDSPLPTPTDVLVALLISHAKDIGSIMKEKDLIVFSEVSTLDLDAAKHDFSLHLIRARSPLLFDHLDLDHLNTLFLSTVDVTNFPFFQTHPPLIKSNEKVAELFAILANFRVSFDRSTSSHDFALVCMQLVRNYLAGNYVHAVIEHEREQLYFQHFNIVKVYNTFFYILSDLHGLLAGKLAFPPTNPRFTDATLLESFFKELLRAGLTEELYDLANFKKEAIGVPAFESDLFHFARNTNDHATLVKLRALVDKLRGLRIFSYKLDVVGQLVESRLFLEAERLSAFEDAFVYKDPADFARNFAGYFKGFKQQLKVREFEERERKADLGHTSSREEYRTAMQVLKVDKDWTLKDSQMVDFITRTIDLFTLHARDLKFDTLFDSLVEIGVRQIFSGVLSRFLKSDGIPPQFFDVVEDKNRLKPFLAKIWPLFNDNLTLTENLVVFMATDCTDYESLSNLLRASRAWFDYSRRSDLIGGKRYVSYRRDALEDVVELKMEKKGVEEVEGWDNSRDKIQEARAKVVLRYLLSDPQTGQFFFSKFFPMTTLDNLEVNFGILLRIIRASWKFKGVGVPPTSRTSQFFSEVLAGLPKDSLLKDHPRIQALRLFCFLVEKEYSALTPTLFDDIYDLEKLDKLLANPAFAEALLRLEPLILDIVRQFVQGNSTLVKKDLPSLRVLGSVVTRNIPGLLPTITDNNAIYNLTMLVFLSQRTASTALEKVRLLSLLPTSTLNAVALIRTDEGRLEVDETKAAALLSTSTDPVVQTTLAAILRPAALRDNFRAQMADIMSGI
jgi:hypothetical protein